MTTQLEGLEGMDFQGDTQGTPQTDSEAQTKSMTALKLQFEAEVGAIRRRIGGLNSFLSTHGMKQRDLARLIMVDPSAVHRWVKEEGKTPAYVWRILDYFHALELAPDRDITRRLRRQIEDLEIEMTKIKDQVHARTIPSSDFSTDKDRNLPTRSMNEAFSVGRFKFNRLPIIAGIFAVAGLVVGLFAAGLFR